MNNNYTLSQLASIYCIYKDLSPTTHTVNCCTCGKTLYIEQPEDCFNYWGHYINRSISRKLIYHPQNSFAQCINCNVYNNGNKIIEEKYNNYIKYRYGNDFKNKLLASEEKTEDYYKTYYINELLKLSQKFPELIKLLADSNTGELICNVNIKTYNNDFEEQFSTFSVSYKSDLDILTKQLNTNPIEWERL